MNKKKFEVEVKLLTGLHIGSGNDKLQIGGVDSAVIKDPVSKLPYIPGSSLKGKIRCLLETEGGYEKGELDDELNAFFGFNNAYIQLNDRKKESEKSAESPTRLIFRDLFLAEPYRTKFQSGEYLTEFKTEVVINRKEGRAQQGGLRTIERVPPEVSFSGEIVIRYENDEELKKIKQVLEKGVDLLNSDYLGGSGSRGYGAVKLTIK